MEGRGDAENIVPCFVGVCASNRVGIAREEELLYSKLNAAGVVCVWEQAIENWRIDFIDEPIGELFRSGGEIVIDGGVELFVAFDA